jgi:hypothetical protein
LAIAAEAVFWVLIAFLAVALVATLARLGFSPKSGKEPSEPRQAHEPDALDSPVLGGDKDVARLLEKARRAAERGELDLAIDAAHAAAIQGLSAAGHVEVERDRTNGDYLRELRKAPPLQQQLQVIVSQVEVAQFGGAALTQSSFDQVLEQVMSLLRRLAVLSLFLVSATLLLGCGGAQAGGDDVSPAGLYTFKRILSDQGTKVHVRVAPLTKLDDSSSIVVVYAMEPAEIEQKRLLSWVEDGGSLFVVASSTLSKAGQVELTQSGCGTSARRGPRIEGPPLTLAVLGESTLKLVTKPSHEVTQLIDVSCGGSPYIVTSYVGAGSITFMPEGELLSNASLSVADNARLVAEEFFAPGSTVELVGSWTGDGAQSPIQSLKSAGLMPVMLQLFGLALLLAVRQGTSFGARRDEQQQERRAFSDHVRAVASNYARAGADRLASGHYALLLLEQLRERLFPGQKPTLLQLGAAVARRVGRPENEIVRVLVEAKTALDDVSQAQNVDYELIRELETLSSQAGGFS